MTIQHPQDVKQQRRKKTTSQLRREEWRRQESDSKNANEAVKDSKEAENIIDNKQKYA